MITIRTFETIADVPEEWDSLQARHTLMQSRKFWRLVEDVRLNQVECRYLVAYETGEFEPHPLAACACYLIRTDVAIFAGGRLRRLLGWIRRQWPGFAQLRMLECGTPITLNPPMLGPDGMPSDAVIAAFDRELTGIARKAGCLVMVLRDFEPPQQAQLAQLQQLGYHAVDNLPNTRLAIDWDSPQAYQAAMRSYFRSKLRRMLRKNRERGISHRLVDDFSDLAGRLSAQWAAVSQQADEYQREFLSADFYRRFSSDFADNAKVLLFQLGDEWIAHALLLIDGDTLRWLFYGRERPANDGLYVYVGNSVVETAIELGLKQVEMGMTCYPIKKDLGVRMLPMQMALKSPWRPLHPLVGWGYRLLNRIPPVEQRRVFQVPKE